MRPMICGAVMVVLSCAPATHPLLDLTVSRRTVADGTPVQVRVTGTDAAGKIGTGTVTITSEAGSLTTPVDLQLDKYGTATAELICDPRSEAACGETFRVTASWTSDKETVTAEQTLSGSSTGAGGGGGTGGGGGNTILGTHSLAELPGPRLWTNLLPTSAVDSQERLFVTDGNSVFIGNGTPSIYLTRDEIKAAAMVNFDNSAIVELDVASDDQLYIVVEGFNEPNSILVSAGPHVVTKKFDVANSVGFLFNFSSVSPERFVIAGGYNGIFEVTSAGTRLLYPSSVVDVSNCASPNLVGLTNHFLYTPGCNGSNLIAGRMDGMGASLVHSPVGQNIWGVGRAPNDAVVMNEVDKLIYFTALDGGVREIRTVPDIPTFASRNGLFSNLYGFDLAVGPSASFYLVGGPTIYVAR